MRACTLLAGVLLISSPALFGQMNYQTNGDVITVTGCSGAFGDVTIPDFVTAIGDWAFMYCASMTSLTIPNSVTTIGNNAFWNCTSLTSVSIGNSVTNIGDSALGYCYSLTNVTIGDSVTTIGDWTFGACLSLTSVTIPDSVTTIVGDAFDCTSLTNIDVSSANPAYSSVNGVLFNKNQTMLCEYPDGINGGYTIPNSVTSIGYCAFEDCSGLTNVIIPDSVTSIGDVAFENCWGLTNVIIPNSVTAIGNYAFCGCYSLTNVIIPNSVTAIGNWTFNGCYNLTNATIGNSVTNIGAHAFEACPSLSNVTIGDSVTSIGDYAFCGCSLTSLTIPNSVTSIGYFAFCECSLTNVTIGNSVTNINNEAFCACCDLAKIYFTGNAPTNGAIDFSWSPATIYYLAGTSGWTSVFDGIPATMLNPPIPTTDGAFGLQNNQFGFTVTGPANSCVLIQTTTDLSAGLWTTLQTCTLTNGSIHFADPAWSNSPGRYYRIAYPCP